VKFGKTITNKDSVGFGNLYTEDAVQMGPNAPQMEGRASIINNLTGALKVGISSGKLTLKVAWGDENSVTDVGVYELNAANGTQVDKYKYMAIFKRVDGQLIIVRVFWNSDLLVVALASK
jgi:ketosteroid isomerase-like protein